MAAENSSTLSEDSDGGRDNFFINRRNPPNNVLFSCQPPQIFDHMLIPQLQALTLNADPPLTAKSNGCHHDANNNSENLQAVDGGSDVSPSASAPLISNTDENASINNGELRYDAYPFTPVVTNDSPAECNVCGPECEVYRNAFTEQLTEPNVYSDNVHQPSNESYQNQSNEIYQDALSEPYHETDESNHTIHTQCTQYNVDNDLNYRKVDSETPLVETYNSESAVDNDAEPWPNPPMVFNQIQNGNVQNGANFCENAPADRHDDPYGAKYETNDLMVQWPAPSLILNNPFYNNSLTYNVNGEPISQVVFPDSYLSVDDACFPPYDFMKHTNLPMYPDGSVYEYSYGNDNFLEMDPWNPSDPQYANIDLGPANLSYPDECSNDVSNNCQSIPYEELKNVEPSFAEYPITSQNAPFTTDFNVSNAAPPLSVDLYDTVGEGYSDSLSPYLEEKSQASPFLQECVGYNTPRESYDVSSTTSPTKELEDLIDFTKHDSKECSRERSSIQPSLEVPSSFSTDWDPSLTNEQGVNCDSTCDSFDPTKSTENFSTEQTDDESSRIITLDDTEEASHAADDGSWGGWLSCGSAQNSEPTPHQIRVLDPDGNTVGVEECAPESSDTRSASASSQEEVRMCC